MRYLLSALLVAAAPVPMAAAQDARLVPQSEWPASVRTDILEHERLCRDSGGIARLDGDIVWRADFNQDGRPDYVANAPFCEGAFGLYGHNAGNPVSIHLSGPRGYTQAWDGLALEGADLRFGPPDLLTFTQRAGSNPSGFRPDGFDSREVTFERGRLVERAARQGPEERWTHDPASGRASLTSRWRSSRAQELSVACESGQPAMNVRYRDGASPSAASVTARFEADGVAQPVRLVRQGTGLDYQARPLDAATVNLLTGRLSTITLADRVDSEGNSFGFTVSLAGSSRAIAAALAGCGTGGPAAPSAASIVPGLPATPRGSAPAAPAGGDGRSEVVALVDRIYSGYLRPPGAGEVAPSEFSASLDRLVEAGSDDLTGLGGDPFCGCQDYDGVAYTIQSATVTGERAEARVAFTNFGETKTFRLLLVRERGRWRVDDIIDPAHGSLRRELGGR